MMAAAKKPILIIELGKFSGLNRNRTKLTLSTRPANKVKYGNNQTLKYGSCGYLGRSFKCARQMLIQIRETAKPGIASI